MAKIKICGLMRAEDVQYANELMPDFVGFILTPGFRRSINKSTAVRLCSMVRPEINKVGVFVNDTMENIDFFVSSKLIDTVQLHGDESPEFCKIITAPTIKYISPACFERADDYDVDMLLFDSGRGTGTTFDWSKIPKTKKPFLLAGGINADNIEYAATKTGAYCIDLSSAAETDGKKDFEKMKFFVTTIKNLQKGNTQ